jgi:hypothetical protein
MQCNTSIYHVYILVYRYSTHPVPEVEELSADGSIHYIYYANTLLHSPDRSMNAEIRLQSCFRNIHGPTDTELPGVTTILVVSMPYRTSCR